MNSVRSLVFLTAVATALLIPGGTAGAEVQAPGMLREQPTPAEKKWCTTSRVIVCAKARGHANNATTVAQANYTAKQLHNGIGDAFRHCYWSARMTVDMGAKSAKGFGDRHEQTKQPAREKTMDLRNNEIGRSIGQGWKKESKTKRYGRVRIECNYRSNHRKLWIINTKGKVVQG